MKTIAAAAHILALITYLLLGAGECALGDTGARIGLNFTGATKLPGIDSPPDTMGAVGPGHIVELVNDTYTVYDKSTGRLLQQMSDDRFWSLAGQRGPASIFAGVCDPRVVYDPMVDRWYATEMECDSHQEHLYVAASISGDPTFQVDDLGQGWRGLTIEADQFPDPADPRLIDYPILGFDANGIYITSILLNATGRPQLRNVSVFSIPKSDLNSQSPTVENASVFEISRPNGVTQCAFTTIAPVINPDPSDSKSILLSANGTLGMLKWELMDTGVQSPQQAHLSAASVIDIDPFTYAPNAQQPNNAPRLDNGTFSADCFVDDKLVVRDRSRFTSALVQQGDSIWGALAADANGRSGIRWYEIDAQTGDKRQEGTIADPQLDLMYPSIAVNQFGDAVIGFTVTGENKFPSAYASVGKTVGGVTSFDDLIELKEGQGTYTVLQDGSRNRWGDYSQTVVDPSDPYSFWTFQEFTKAKDQWAVQITQILLPGAASRADVVAIGPAAAYVARDNAVDGSVDGLGDAASDAIGSFLQHSVQVGETDTTANRLERFVTKFELPDRGAAASDRLENATLRIFLEGIEGTPAGPLSLLHSLSDNDLVRVKSDYEDASYSDTGLVLFQPTDEVGRYFDVDVTELVRADYAQDGISPLSAFRLQINDASFLEDGLSNRYVVTSAGTGRPELLLTFLLTGDFNRNGVLDIADLDDLTVQSAGGGNPQKYDLNADASVNSLDVQVWVKDLDNSWIGDANLDGEFNSSDLVEVLASGTYEADVPSVWSTGDFNGDGRTNSSDLVMALADGGYEHGPRGAAAAVPEPASITMLMAGLMGTAIVSRSRRKPHLISRMY